MENLLAIIHVIACLGVIGLVLMQHGKGADMGAAFGSGSSGSLFGVSGSSNFLSKTTAIFVSVFFLTSIALAFIVGQKSGTGSVVKAIESSEVQKPSETKSGEAQSKMPSAVHNIPK
jgi:preprotein translocase subunit SecG